MCLGRGQRSQLQGHTPQSLVTSVSAPPSCRCCCSVTSPLHRPPKEDKAGWGRKAYTTCPTLVGCILMAFDWIGCSLNSLLGHQKEGREESLIHQTEILIDFQPAGVRLEAPTMGKWGTGRRRWERLRRKELPWAGLCHWVWEEKVCELSGGPPGPRESAIPVTTCNRGIRGHLEGKSSHKATVACKSLDPGQGVQPSTAASLPTQCTGLLPDFPHLS